MMIDGASLVVCLVRGMEQTVADLLYLVNPCSKSCETGDWIELGKNVDCRWVDHVS